MARPTRLTRAFPRPEAGGIPYDGSDVGLDAETVAAALDELAGLIGPGGPFETKDEGGQPTDHDYGTLGATETFDASDGNHLRGTLDQDCTITMASFPDGSVVLAIYQDGTGGWGITWSGVTFAADDQPDQTASSLTFFLIISEDGNRYGFKAGGSVDPDSVREAGRWELAVIPGSPPDSLYADDDWLYIWVPGA